MALRTTRSVTPGVQSLSLRSQDASRTSRSGREGRCSSGVATPRAAFVHSATGPRTTRGATDSGVRAVPLFPTVDAALGALAVRERGCYAPEGLVFARRLVWLGSGSQR